MKIRNNSRIIKFHFEEFPEKYIDYNINYVDYNKL